MKVGLRYSLHMLDGVGSNPLGDKLHRAAQRRRLVVEEGLLEVDLRAFKRRVWTPEHGFVDVSRHPAFEGSPAASAETCWPPARLWARRRWA